MFYRLGSLRLLLDRERPSALVQVQVDDARAATERCRAAGIEILDEPHVIFTHPDDSLGPAGTEEWRNFIKGSEGNTVGLVSHHVPLR